MIPGSFPVVAGRPRPTIVNTDFDKNPNVAEGKSKSYTVSIGTASDSRHVLVALDDSGTVSNFKINGSTPTTHATSGTEMFLYGLDVPTGTTATLTWTVVTDTAQEMMGVWAAYDLVSTTAFGTSSIANDNASPTPFNCNTPDLGVLVAFSITRQIAPTATATWTGVTEDFDAKMWRDAYSGGSIETSAAETPRTLSLTWTTTAGAHGIAASFA
jgi:hypothetical protein